MPINGETADVVDIVEGYSRWLATSETPKLFVDAESGVIRTGAQRKFCRVWRDQ